MIQVTRPVLIAAVAGVVAICAIAVAAWRLYVAGEGPAPVVATRASPGPAAIAPPVPTPVAPSSEVAPAAPSAAVPSESAVVAAPPPPGAGTGPVPPAEPAKAPAEASKPSFDVIRIDPSGDAVVAGRAEPSAQVALTLAGKPLAQAQADADGQFVMLPPKLPPGDHILGLRATSANGETTSEQTVAIAVPARGERETIAALSAPDKPTVVLSQPGGPASDSAQGRELRITSIEAQQGGAFFASGVAPPGAALRLYLNEAYVASVEAGADGKWSIRIERGMSPGAYRVRADRVGGDGRATARVEAPFDYPAEFARQVAAATPPAAAPATPASPPASAGPSAAPAGANPPAAAPEVAAAGAGRSGDAQNAVVEEVRTARVERGDSLWRISVSIYGQGIRYTQIYDANVSQIRDPDLIYPGQVLVVPKKDEQKPAGERQR